MLSNIFYVNSSFGGDQFTADFYASLGLQPLPEGKNEGVWLTSVEGALTLVVSEEGRQQLSCVDFCDPSLLHRLHTSGKHQGIGQAVGLNKVSDLSVLDCTAGLGRDAFILAGLGCQVVMLERHPVVHALLTDGLRRVQEGDQQESREICSRLQLHKASGHDWLASVSEKDQPDVIYLDPMFPERHKSAKVKKDMAGLQHVVGPDEDVLSLLVLARKVAKRRVVVKRPRSKDMDYLENRLKPAFQLLGKAMQFDVFLPYSR